MSVDYIIISTADDTISVQDIREALVNAGWDAVVCSDLDYQCPIDEGASTNGLYIAACRDRSQDDMSIGAIAADERLSRIKEGRVFAVGLTAENMHDVYTSEERADLVEEVDEDVKRFYVDGKWQYVVEMPYGYLSEELWVAVKDIVAEMKDGFVEDENEDFE